MVDKNTAHHLGADGEEVSATVPIDPRLVHQLQIRFMNQRRRLKGVIRSLARKISLGQLAKLIVHQRHQTIRGAGILPHRVEEVRNLRGLSQGRPAPWCKI